MVMTGGKSVVAVALLLGIAGFAASETQSAQLLSSLEGDDECHDEHCSLNALQVRGSQLPADILDDPTASRPVANGCAYDDEQCGGTQPGTEKPWEGPTCCTGQSKCVFKSHYYSSCKAPDLPDEADSPDDDSGIVPSGDLPAMPEPVQPAAPEPVQPEAPATTTTTTTTATTTLAPTTTTTTATTTLAPTTTTTTATTTPAPVATTKAPATTTTTTTTATTTLAPTTTTTTATTTPAPVATTKAPATTTTTTTTATTTPAPVATTKAASTNSCRDTKASDNDDCWRAVSWAMSDGVYAHPEWYPGLNPRSGSAAFQASVHASTPDKCPAPCSGAPAPQAANCHDASAADADKHCWHAVEWAMRQGVREHPSWYPGLHPGSKAAAFQAIVHKTNPKRCPAPCGR
eukprot:TRINITY_DN7890_c0_g1_i4.p1 TRINITY_DN7890_c0_g1~~TRINITY_DN7890_c0_g1_i4.p1  ORF type:complete len:404 (+),score=74.51 TRINITY_DN7890_c0_g1_i4:62-1273(+)